MLLELALYLVTPAPWRHRRLGYVRESVLLTSRARRCRTAWAPHCAAARAAMREAAAGLARRETVVVLGSGGLADVPLADLAALFGTVVLADAVHPLGARLAARRSRNVRLVTADLLRAGAIADLCGQADLTISANLLSQLPIVPLEHGEARRLPVPEGLGAGIVSAHLAALDRLQGRVCLIADTEQRAEDRTGRVTERLDLLHGITLPAPARSWDWELAPFGEAERHRRLVHRVHAYPDWRAQRPNAS